MAAAQLRRIGPLETASKPDEEGELPYHEAYVINRRGDDRRLAAFGMLAAAAGVNFTRFEAVDKDTTDPDELAEGGEMTGQIAKIWLRRPETRGKYACTLSHNRLWRQLAHEREGKVMVVFEDDSQIPEGFNAELRRAMEHVPADWDFLYLNHELLSGEYVGDGFWLKPDYEHPTTRKTNGLANAYIVRPQGLRRILQFQHPVGYTWSNDANLRRHFPEFNAYFLVKPLVPQSGTLSVRKSKDHENRL